MRVAMKQAVILSWPPNFYIYILLENRKRANASRDSKKIQAGRRGEGEGRAHSCIEENGCFLEVANSPLRIRLTQPEHLNSV